MPLNINKFNPNNISYSLNYLFLNNVNDIIADEYNINKYLTKSKFGNCTIIGIKFAKHWFEQCIIDLIPNKLLTETTEYNINNNQYKINISFSNNIKMCVNVVNDLSTLLLKACLIDECPILSKTKRNL